MKKNNVLLTSAALLLVACGSSSGGSGGDSGTQTTDINSSNPLASSPNTNITSNETVDSNAVNYIDPETGDYYTLTSANGDEILTVTAGRGGDTYYFVNEEFQRPNQMESVGTHPHRDQDASDDMYASGHYRTYYGADGPSVIYGSEYFVMEEYAYDVDGNPLDPDTLTQFVSASEAANYGLITFDDVYSTLTIPDGNGGWTTREYDNGQIFYDPNSSNWSANLANGDVELQGQIDGYRVSGDSHYNDMTGVFEGYDIIEVRPDDTVLQETGGVFAGSETGTAWAGVWSAGR